MLAFVQPFGLSSPGGGARILRALAHDPPVEVMSIVTSPNEPPPTTELPEVHLAARPYFGRIERTRFNSWFSLLDPLFAPRFRSRFKKLIVRKQVTALHIIVHSADSVDAALIAIELGLPFFLSVHDDLAYLMARQSNVQPTLAKFATVWSKANGRFVISREMGEEYCARYGSQSYSVVTDGLVAIAPAPRQLDPDSLRVYFMGLFHYSYQDNLKSLIAAMDAISVKHPNLDVSLTLRCGSIFDSIVLPEHLRLTVLPFASEAQVAADMESADVLYMPLPLEARHQGFIRFSLSTKMITYLGSGIPIFFHGPVLDSAAGSLLQRNGAAFCSDSLDPDQIEARLLEVVKEYDTITRSALALARSQFRLEDNRKRFWDPILSVIAHQDGSLS